MRDAPGTPCQCAQSPDDVIRWRGFPLSFRPRSSVESIHLDIWIELDVAPVHTLSPLKHTSTVSPVLA